MGQTPPRTPPRRRIVVPTRSDSMLRHLTEAVGGPLGKRSAPGIVTPGFFTIERVLLVMVTLMGALALLVKDHCQRDGWSTPDQYTTACYSEYPNAYKDNGLGYFFPFFGQTPAFDHGPLAGWIAGFTGWVVSALPGTGSSSATAVRQLAYFDLNAFLIVVCWAVAAIAVARSTHRRPWDGALVALSPLMLFAAMVGWEFWAAGLLAVAVAALAKGRSLSAGILTGLAFSVSPYAAVLLVAVAVAGIRTRQAATTLAVAAGAVLGAAVVTVPILLNNPASYLGYWQRVFSAQPAVGSMAGLYNLVMDRLGYARLSNDGAAWLSWGLMLVLMAAVVVLVLRVNTTPRIAQIAALLAACYLLCSPQSSPAQWVVLLPLLAVARPSWRSLLLWQAVVLLTFFAWQEFLGKQLGDINAQHAIDMPYFVLAEILLGAATLAVLGQIVVDMVQPNRSLVHPGKPLPAPVKIEGESQPREEDSLT